MSWPQLYQRSRNSLGGSCTKNYPEERRYKEPVGSPSALERVLCPDEAKVMQRANQIVMYVNLFKFGDGL